MYKERIRKFLTGLLVLCMVFAMNGFSKVSAAKKVAATKVTITNAYTVMAVGQSANFNCKLTPSKSTDKVTWKSSDESIAKPDKNGKFTALKTGTVTITAKASSGVKASVKVLVVSKNGVTSLQSRVDKMLAAKNIKNITIKNLKTEESYVIAKGNYSTKKLFVNAPLSDVENNGTFKEIVINDVKNGTFVEKAGRNKIVVKDQDCAIKIAEGASIYSLTVNNGNGVLNLENNGKIVKSDITDAGTVNIAGSGEVKNLSVKADASISVAADSKVNKVTVGKGVEDVKIDAKGSIKSVVVTEPTNLVLTGTKKVNVVINAAAVGTKITASVPVDVKTDAKITLTLNAGAEGSTVSTTVDAKDIELDNHTTTSVEITKGNDTPTKVDPVVTTTPAPSTGGSSVPGSTVIAKTVTGVVSGSAVSFTLPTTLDKVSSVNVAVKVNGLEAGFDIGAQGLQLVRKALAANIDSWKNITNKTFKDGNVEFTVEGATGATEKTVKFSGLTFKVNIQGTTEADAVIHVTKGSTVYTLTKSADNKVLYISSSANNTDAIAKMVTFTVLY